MRIDHNIPALQAWMSVKNTQREMQTSIQRLSTGHRINSAADDAAGYAIVEKMMGQVNGLNTAIQNSQNAISAIQTASGALNQTQSILQRMRELGVEASNDTNTQSDRQQIQKEVNQLTSQIDQIRNTTQFNTQVLLNGNLNSTGASGSATLVNPSNTITGVSISGSKIENTTTLTINTIETGTASAPNAVQVYYNGNLINTGTSSTTQSASITSNKLTVNVSGGSANGGSSITVDLKNLTTTGTPTLYTSSSASAYQVVDTGAVRLDKATGNKVGDNNDMTFQVGANQSQTIQLGINDMGAQALGLETTSGTKNSATDIGNGFYSAINMTTKQGAQSSISLIDNAIQVVSTESAKLGAVQNRLTHITQNLQTASTNLTSAQSTIKDVDMAKEMMTFSKQQILLQSSMAMLAQANSNPQQVLRLFR